MLAEWLEALKQVALVKGEVNPGLASGQPYKPGETLTRMNFKVLMMHLTKQFPSKEPTDQLRAHTPRQWPLLASKKTGCSC